MKAILVSGANAAYFPLVQGLFASYLVQPQANVALGLIGENLPAQAIDWLEQHHIQHRPLQHDIAALGVRPQRPQTLSSLQYAKVFLPDYFPDYELIFWLDADTWIQDAQVVSLYLSLAQAGKWVMTSETHRAYVSHYDPSFSAVPYRLNQMLHNAQIASQLQYCPVFNTGAFALQRHSPVWACWQSTLTGYLRRSHHVLLEQMALNYLVYSRQIPAPAVLPAYCNFNCYLALPVFDPLTGVFYEPPNEPWQKIWLMHLTGPEKNKVYRLKTPEGEDIQKTLLYTPPSSRAKTES